jgi:hypothetical protein
MSDYYADYIWIGGVPHGTRKLSNEAEADCSYKISMDPYRKRISIEKYAHEAIFSHIVYDSALFDFRHLKNDTQMAWQKVVASDTPDHVTSLIRDQDDRLILIEKYEFENQMCRRCTITSPHGILLSRQNMYYTALKDSFNGVILFDSNCHPIVCKKYECNDNGYEFTKLLSVEWDMRKQLIQ